MYRACLSQWALTRRAGPEGLVDMDHGYISAGEDTVTSARGIFAAGDVGTKPLRQIITAAADGANAITSVERYLVEN